MLPAAETDVIPDTGHTCSIKRPDKYTTIIRESLPNASGRVTAKSPTDSGPKHDTHCGDAVADS
jgi:hypothetical protein